MAGPIYQVLGPAVVNVGTGAAGANNGLGSSQFLGIARGKIQISINIFENKIMADNAGKEMPVDIQEMGSDATIRMTLTQWDPAVMTKLDNGIRAAVGTPIAAAGLAFLLNIPQTLGGLPWSFPVCKLRPYRQGDNTEYSELELEFYAWRNIQNATVLTGIPLFTRT